MSTIAIIADDLTGANATGVLLANKGYKTAVVLNPENLKKNYLKNYQVIAVNTDSRSVSPAKAYQRVEKTVKTIQSLTASEAAALFCKRIDSTLRGNIGQEIDAVLDFLGKDSMAAVVPAFPESGRSVIGGYLMVNSVPLAKTDVAQDIRNPVHQSNAVKIIARQTKYDVGWIGLDTVLQGVEAIKAAYLKQQKKGRQIVVFDAMTNEDIKKISTGVYQSLIKTIPVDPGPFSSALSENYLIKPASANQKKILMVVGSVTPLIRNQLKNTVEKYNAASVEVSPKSLINPSLREKEISNAVQETIKKMAVNNIVALHTSSKEKDSINSGSTAGGSFNERDISMEVVKGLARITGEILSQIQAEALYVSGGDTAAAVCREIKADGIEVREEVLPLAAYGYLIGGLYPGLPIVTKGGMVGGQEAMSSCIAYLLKRSAGLNSH